MPEEETLYGRYEDAQMYGDVEEITVQKAECLICVTNKIKEHLQKKYGNKFKAKTIIMPIFDSNLSQYDIKVPKEKKFIDNKPVVIYAGGIMKWQKIELMQASIHKCIDAANYIVCCPNPKEFWSTWEYSKPKNLTVSSKSYQDLCKDVYMKAHYGYVLRDDITVNNVLFSNKSAARRMVGADDIFGQMEKDVAVSPKKFSKVEEISAQDFIDKVLPTAKEIEAFVENKHEKNFVSMIAPVNPDAKTMFKWNNGLSWAYSGNITDSDMKQNVKAAGGNVDGVLRFSIQWNEDGHDNYDLDAHCVEPDGTEIYYGSYKAPRITFMGGQLDVDVIDPRGKVAVENITWQNLSRMRPGIYRFFVHQYSGAVRHGFRAEVEFNGEIYSFDYSNPMRTGENVQVAEVTLDENGNFSIKEKLSGSSSISSREIWGVNTNKFVPVSVISYSPNYFDEQDGIGHRHLFFFLKDCVNNESPNGYYNEFLKSDLEKHKRVFEALGAKCHVEDTDDQLSGIGFSMTKRADLVVKVKGATERVMKIKF